MAAVEVLIHAHVHPTVTMVHVDAAICMGLIPHLYHPDILIGYSHGRDYHYHSPDRNNNLSR